MHLSLDALYKSNYLLKADNHLAISSEIKNQYIQLGINKNNIFTIFNPSFKCNIIITRPENKINFIYVGRLHDNDKNISGLLHTISNISGQCELHIIGSGCDEIQLKTLATVLNLNSSVFWHGWQNNPWEYISKNIEGVNALLLNSNIEGFPMIL